MSRFNRYDHRCDFCGRFMSWEWVSQWNCFAGYARAWCRRVSCTTRALGEGGA